MFRAMIEIRTEAFESKSAKTFQLADLFHNVPKQLLHGVDESELLRELHQRAGVKGIEPWLDHATNEITKTAVLKTT